MIKPFTHLSNNMETYSNKQQHTLDTYNVNSIFPA